MPELPEVETIIRKLNQAGLPGKIVQSASLFWPRTLAQPDYEQLQQRLAGQTAGTALRRGKFIILPFEGDTLLIHLRMSGDLRLENNLLAPANHDRFALIFTDGWRLTLNDARKFARVWLTTDPLEVTAALGPEPLNGSLTSETFHQRLISRRRQLKPLLLDQRFIAGLGNIYTDEALHHARLHPLRHAHTLTRHQSDNLLEAIRQVLQEGIQRNGASIDWVYRGGGFQNNFTVYQRTGKPCPDCGTTVARITVGQRGTHFCPACQPTESEG
jgi:formamidopyrimidine-DNA glycosylase